ncbi:MAG: uroporphyrinogen-III synthase [Flavobacteriales bacterium]|nr:uroporphyrinogen-III synthase [Flavobacteriales bacterium]
MFLSSPRATRYFFEQHPTTDLKIGVIGNASAEAAPPHIPIDFIGQGDTQQVAQQFKSLIGESKVLFPTSDRSIRTVQEQLAEGQALEQTIYTTSLHPVNIPECDAYFFTSPSNVESFVSQQQLPEGAKVIAKGKSTLRALNEHTKNAIVALNYSASGSWSTIFSVLHS